MAKYRMDTLFQFPWYVEEFNVTIRHAVIAPVSLQFPWCVGEFNLYVDS